MTTELERAKRDITAEFVKAWTNGDYFPTEFQPEVNDKTRGLIKAYKKHHGQAWIGNINLYGKDRGKRSAILKRCPAFVHNFDASFIIPCHDPELIDLIYYRDTAPYTGVKEDAKRVAEITNRLETVGGLFLHWV